MSSSAPQPVQALLDRVLAADAPLSLRMAAARGALPLPRPSLRLLQVRLLEDTDPAVRAQAQASLETLDREELLRLFADGETPGPVLAHLVPRALRDDELASRLIAHPQVPEGAIRELAARGSASVLDAVLTNQQRLLRSPELLDVLSKNPALRNDQRGRILDMIQYLVPQPAAATGSELPEPEAAALLDAEPERAARLLDVDPGELFAASEILDGEEFERDEDPRVRHAYRRILTLTTAQKALLALRGGREERRILVRDSNKVVALCVLRNPKVSEQEIETIARMRNVHEEVLRTIGTNREWVRNYSIIAGLVRNPRTPPGIATNFVPRLNTHDLKILAQDKNVPEIIRRMAKRVYETRTQRMTPRSPRGKK